MPPPIPRCSNWAYSSLNSPSCFNLPRYGSRVGLHIFLFEACSTFTRVAACTLALSPIRDTLIEGFSHFVTSMTAPIASGWSGCRVGLAPTGKRRLCTAHTLNGHLSNRPPSYFWMANGATFRPSYIPSAPPPENYRPNCVRIQSYLAPGPTLRGVCSLGSVSRRAPSDIRPVSEAIAELKATAVHQLQRRHLATATSLIPHDLPN